MSKQVMWIELDDRTAYRIQSDNAVLVSAVDEDALYTIVDEVAIAESLGVRLGGTWRRSSEWSIAEGEPDVTSTWTQTEAGHEPQS